MTESTPFFDGPPEGEEGAASSNRNVALAGGLVAALVLAGAGYFFLLGGSSSDDVSLAPVTSTRVHGTKTHPIKKNTKPAVKPPKKGAQIPVVSVARLGHDPFLALYIKPAVVTVAPPTVATAPMTVTGSAPAATTPTSTTTTGGTTTAPPPAAPKTYALRLNRVYGQGKDLTAVFSIDNKTFLAKVGSVFGPTAELKMLSLQQNSKGIWTAVLQVGDGQPFDAPVGQTLYVS